MTNENSCPADPNSNESSFEALLMNLSASFINVKSEALDTCINNALKSIVMFLCVDRGTVGWFDRGQGVMRVTHSFAVDGIDPVSQLIGEAQVPYLTRHIREGKSLFIEQLEDLPAAAATDVDFARRSGVKSAAAVPLAVSGTVLGLVSFASLRAEREWSPLVSRRLQLIGEVFANALLRRMKETELVRAYENICLLKERADREKTIWREHVISRHGTRNIIGESMQMQKLLHRVEQVAQTDSTVLVLGETGTGKELITTAIHERSHRSKRPYIRVNCGALAPTLFESELFGYEKGAFTGALKNTPGRFEIADGGSIVLDEIGELPMELQPKLLRVLQDGQFERVGSSKTRVADVRLIASTNRDLETMALEGEFRLDLFYRLGIFPITVPPLKEHKEDIPTLTAYFVERLQPNLFKKIKRIPDREIDKLMSYDWPGNVRELKNVIERSLILSSGSELIVTELGRGHQRSGKKPVRVSDSEPSTVKTLVDVEREHIRSVCERCRWKIEGVGGAAEMLDINPNTLRSRMKKLGISKPKKP